MNRNNKVRYFKLGVMGVKLYHRGAAVEKVQQHDPRVLARGPISAEHQTEMDETQGKTVTGRILYFPEDGFYAYRKCDKCKATTAAVEKGEKEKQGNRCSKDDCDGHLKDQFKLDLVFITKTEQIMTFTAFNEILSPFDQSKNQKNQSLESRFKKLLKKSSQQIFLKTTCFHRYLRFNAVVVKLLQIGRDHPHFRIFFTFHVTIKLFKATKS